MAWDLALPLLIMLATAIVGVLIYFSARKLMFDPRAEDGTDSVAGDGNYAYRRFNNGSDWA